MQSKEVRDMAAPQVITGRLEVPGYAKIFGVLGLILAILGFVIPVFGVLFVTPLAIVSGAMALYGQYRGMGIAVLIINVINLIVSPTFWLNIVAGAAVASASANRALTYFDVAGVIVMFGLLVWKRV
jgi:hypothetical protein